MFLQKDYPKKKIVCTSDQKMRTHEQNSKIAFVIDLYKLRKFFGKKYRGRKKMQFTETETIQSQIRALFTIYNIRYRDWRQGASPNKNPASSTFSLVPAHHQDKTRL